MVQWYDVSLPRMRPGFDSRQVHFFMLIMLIMLIMLSLKRIKSTTKGTNSLDRKNHSISWEGKKKHKSVFGERKKSENKIKVDSIKE